MSERALIGDINPGLRTSFHDESDGSLVVARSEDVGDLITENKRDFNAKDERARWSEHEHVARIPPSIYYDLKRRGIIDDEKKFRAWLNHPDNRAFRTRPGKI